MRSSTFFFMNLQGICMHMQFHCLIFLRLFALFFSLWCWLISLYCLLSVCVCVCVRVESATAACCNWCWRRIALFLLALPPSSPSLSVCHTSLPSSSLPNSFTPMLFVKLPRPLQPICPFLVCWFPSCFFCFALLLRFAFDFVFAAA